MENRGVCTNCGIAVNLPHTCSADIARLVEIDRESGCGRAVREILISEGKKGFGDKLENLENEAISIRARL